MNALRRVPFGNENCELCVFTHVCFMKVKTIMKHIVAIICGCLKLLNTLKLNFMAEAIDLL